MEQLVLALVWGVGHSPAARTAVFWSFSLSFGPQIDELMISGPQIGLEMLIDLLEQICVVFIIYYCIIIYSLRCFLFLFLSHALALCGPQKLISAPSLHPQPINYS